MTLLTIISLVYVLLNISYTIALLIVCIRERNVETVTFMNLTATNFFA